MVATALFPTSLFQRLLAPDASFLAPEATADLHAELAAQALTAPRAMVATALFPNILFQTFLAPSAIA